MVTAEQQQPKSTGLSGMKEIAKYWGRSQATMLKLIQEERFPARKIAGNWESDTVLIDEWRRQRILHTPLTPQQGDKGQAKAAPSVNPYTKGKQIFGPSSTKNDRGW